MQGCSVCTDQIKASVLSPDSKYIATIVHKSCPVLTESTGVHLEERRWRWVAHADPVVASKYAKFREVRWLDAHQLQIACVFCDKETVIHARNWRDVHIRFVEWVPE
jgi:hypothetical protein